MAKSEDEFTSAKRAAQKASRDILKPAQDAYKQTKREALKRFHKATRAALDDYCEQIQVSLTQLALAGEKAKTAYSDVMEARKRDQGGKE